MKLKICRIKIKNKKLRIAAFSSLKPLNLYYSSKNKNFLNFQRVYTCIWEDEMKIFEKRYTKFFLRQGTIPTLLGKSQFKS